MWPFSRKPRSEEVDDEIAAHLAMAERDRVERGQSPQSARAAARRDLGSQAFVKETTREAWGWTWLENLTRDIRYAMRRLRRSPGFALTVILLLALGIGANTVVFSLVNALMLRLLPIPHPEQLVELLFKAPGQDHENLFDWRNYEHYRENNQVFSGLVAASDTSFSIRGDGLEPEIVRGGYVSTNYFSTLGVKPALGRLISREDESPGSLADAAVVSWSYWQKRFNLDRAIVGRRISESNHPLIIVGVAPRGFVGLETGNPQDIWLALTAQHPANASTAKNWLKFAGRLKPGVSIDQARAQMSVLWQWTLEDEFKTNGDATVRQWKMEVQPAATGLSHLRDQMGKPALVLMAVTGLLLLIACSSIASLLLARGSARRREMAVRVSLGASRFRLLRQQFTEILMLAIAGALLGALLAYWGTGVLVGILGSGRERVELQASPDGLVLLVTAAVALFTGLLCGLAPAWQTFRSAPVVSLRLSDKAGETRIGRLFGKSLVVTQVALSVVLLSAAALFIRHLSNLEHLNLGFQRDHVLLLDINAEDSGYSREQLSRAYQELLERLEAVPGVRSATLAGFYPMAGVGAMRPANVEGYEAKPGERRFLSQNWVAPKYFATFGIPLIMGRDFSFQDLGRPRVAIVNQTFAYYFFRDGNPIGKHILFDGGTQPFEIVGVVGNAKSGDLREPALRFVYFNTFQLGNNFSHFALRTAVSPEAVAGDVRRAVRESLKTVAVEDIQTLDEQVDGAIVPERLSALLSGLFGGLGALLAALGIYGLLAYAVAQRTSEIGIRMAIGATRTDITRMVLREAVGMSCAGLVAGGFLAYGGKRFVASLIPDLPTQSLLPIVFGAAVMVALAMIAAYLPARHATRIDPRIALQSEGAP